ncbi:YhcN/YlaJ family sporulation lipoprotein [Ammoniphilus resinae]|uniref:Uncharacterized protein n=1 Tax=Ammoniphilus resinae TaxID=861532 RepID=A0ABS4GRT4_9BACL|nr:YhcN/YlaJ family sporulation lipoprotein [Ammoniphilus resinae]MBP1932969.1 hypothetical protein [Ammoniphilus resinae]
MKKLISQTVKMFMIPALVIGGLSACGYGTSDNATNRGYGTTSVNNYDGFGTYNNNYRTVTPYNNGYYNGYGYNGMNNGYNGTNNYGYGTSNYNNGYGTNNYGYGTNNYGFGANTYGWHGNNTMRNNTFSTNKLVATRVVNLANDVPGVTRAVAVVQGNDIVVGIEGKGHKNLKTLEKDVKGKILRHEKGFKVHVTSDKNLTSRINTIHRNLTTNNTGHPIRAMGEDVASLIRDMGRTVTAPFR